MDVGPNHYKHFFMTYKKAIVPLILLFGILNVKFTCYKNHRDKTQVILYDFKQNVTITPYQLNYTVGDTIWLNVNIPGKKLLDERTNTKVFFDSASFSAKANVSLVYNNPFISTGPFASFVFPTGVSAHTGNGLGDTYASIDFGCSSSVDYNLVLGIVLKEKGVFGISFFSQGFEKCFAENYQYSTLTYSLDVMDNHQQYYQQLDFAAIGKQPDATVLDRLHRKAMVVVNVL